jgi:hypothetical protein
MATLGTILYFVGLIGSLICWIMVLIKMFPAEGVLKGILAIICSLYAFIWGWINAGRFNLRNIMWGWTASLVVLIIGALLGGVGAQSAFPQGFDASHLPLLVSVAMTVTSLVF